MFNKRIASEDSRIIPAETGDVARIFDKLGKNEATELEIRRKAKEMGIRVSNLGDSCKSGKENLLSPKWSK